MGFDFARRKAEIQAAVDLNAIKQGELVSEMRELQREFRDLELRERMERDSLRKKVNPPSGVHK